MRDEKHTPEVGAWLKSREVQPVDSRDTARRVVARLPQVRQRSRWWPFPVPYRKSTTSISTDPTTTQPDSIPATNGHSPTVTGRTQSMFSPVKAITAGALAFAIGGAFLIAQPLDQQGSSVPGAATDTEAAAPLEFTAKWAFGPDVRAETREVGEGMWMYRGGAWRPGVITAASDPRLDGTLSVAANNDDYASGPTIFNYAFRIENEEGAWQQLPTINIDTGPDDANTTTGVMVGEGGYDGLVAVFDNVVLGQTWTLHGYIIEGELPPDPEPYVAE